MNSGIYAITNMESDKVYIGSTVSFDERWGQHRRALLRGNHDNSHLQYSWNKYDENAFKFGVLEYLDNLNDLILAEQFWMDVYREEGKELYNFGLAVDNAFRGMHHTEETIQILRDIALARPPISDEIRQKCGDATRGVPLSKEHCDKISASKMGHNVSPETRDKISRIKTGCKLSEEQCGNISQGLLNMDPEVRAECSRIASEVHMGNQYGLGYRHTEEAIQKISEASKAAWANGVFDSEETRRKKSIASSRLRHTKETKLKLSKPYPAFTHRETGEIIPAGVGLAAMCREWGLRYNGMSAVKCGSQHSHKGWILLGR